MRAEEAPGRRPGIGRSTGQESLSSSWLVRLPLWAGLLLIALLVPLGGACGWVAGTIDLSAKSWQARELPARTAAQEADRTARFWHDGVKPGPTNDRGFQGVTRVLDGGEMVVIPGGEFSMGSDDRPTGPYPSSAPRHRVVLSPFAMDQHEVSVAQYARYRTAIGRSLPRDMRPLAPDLPAVDVTWWDAADFCEWAGCRLPTEAEWEYAAGGAKGWRYPWGNDPTRPDWAVAAKSPRVTGKPYTPADWLQSVSPSARWSGPFGLVDLSGNAEEWCFDRYQSGYHDADGVVDPRGPAPRDHRDALWGFHVIRGCALTCSDDWLSTIASRRGEAPHYVMDSRNGFRCAASAAPR